MRRLTASFFALAILPGLALAQTPPAPPPPPDAMDNGGPPPPPPGGWQGGGGWHHHGHDMDKWKAKFDAANTTHDGHLTLAQAEAAGMKPIVDHFSEIDTAKRGYVTFNEVQAWHLDEMAKRLEAQAAQLRAGD